MRLPLPFNGHSNVELTKPTVQNILDVYDSAQGEQYYKSMLDFMDGNVLSEDGEPIPSNELRKMPIVSAEVVIVELFKMYGLPTKVEGVYACPRFGCGHKVVQEETKESDNRFDIQDLDVIVCNGDDVNFRLELNTPIICGSEEKKLTITALTFAPVTIGDMIRVSSDHTIKKESRFTKKIFLTALIDMDANYTGQEEMTIEKAKNRFQFDILEFPDIAHQNTLILGMRKYGLRLLQDLTCPKCGKEWQAPVPFLVFFAYALKYASETSIPESSPLSRSERRRRR